MVCEVRCKLIALEGICPEQYRQRKNVNKSIIITSLLTSIVAANPLFGAQGNMAVQDMKGNGPAIYTPDTKKYGTHSSIIINSGDCNCSK